jgi:hypothetical protein
MPCFLWRLHSYTLLSLAFCSNPWLDKTIVCISEFETFLNRLAFFSYFPIVFKNVKRFGKFLPSYIIVNTFYIPNPWFHSFVRNYYRGLLEVAGFDSFGPSWQNLEVFSQNHGLSRVFLMRYIPFENHQTTSPCRDFNPTLDLVEYEERSLATGPKLSALPAWACSYSSGAKMFFFVSPLYINLYPLSLQLLYNNPTAPCKSKTIYDI